MTLGRLSLGALARSRTFAGPARVLTTAGIALALLYVAIPIAPVPAAVAALALSGLAMAVVFPTLSSSTADRVGVEAAGRVVTLQLLVANVAATGLSYAVGAGVDLIGTAVPGLVFAALAVGGLPVLLRSLRVHAPASAVAEPAPTPT